MSATAAALANPAPALAATVTFVGLGMLAVVSAAHLLRYIESRRPGENQLEEVVKERWLVYPVPVVASGALLINQGGWVLLAALSGLVLLVNGLFR